MTTPSPNGRDGRGRFATGWRGGPGNPYAAAVGAWRRALTATLTVDDMTAVYRALIDAAKRGEPWAVRELLDRTLGRPVEADLIERLESLESAMLQQGENAA